MAYQLALHRTYGPSDTAPGWSGRSARLTVRCRINLYIAQTQHLNDRLKTDAARGIIVAMILSAGLWAALGVAVLRF